jgi:hypothetical protein
MKRLLERYGRDELGLAVETLEEYAARWHPTDHLTGNCALARYIAAPSRLR